MSALTLAKAIDLFLGEHQASTALAYRYGLVLLTDLLGGELALAAITPEQLLAFAQVLRGRGNAPATVYKNVKSLKTFLNWCVKIGFLEVSPARVIKNSRPPRNIARDKAMTDEELDALLDYLRYKQNPRDFALVLFLADSGCRRGGAAGLRLTDIEWDSLRATVTEKGNKTRTVAFSQTCADAIRHWLMYRSDHYRIRGDYVFSRDGLAINPELLSQAIRRACQQLGLRSLGSHSLRHRKGHQFAEARIAPTLAATYLGHADAMMTLSFYYPADWEAAERAGRELMGDTPPAAPQPQDRPDQKIIPFRRSKHA